MESLCGNIAHWIAAVFFDGRRAHERKKEYRSLLVDSFKLCM
jgi:hypothetical protein